MNVASLEKRKIKENEALKISKCYKRAIKKGYQTPNPPKQAHQPVFGGKEPLSEYNQLERRDYSLKTSE